MCQTEFPNPDRSTMLWSQLFIPTLREDPSEAISPGQKLLLRAGYMRLFAGGKRGYLPLGQRSLEKIERMVREEMKALGAQEFALPGISPAELTSLAGNELRGARQFPQIWFQLEALIMEGRSFDQDAAGQEVFSRHESAFRKIFARCGPGITEVEWLQGTAFVKVCETGEALIVLCPSCGYAATLDVATSHASHAELDDPDHDLPPEAFHTPGRKTIAEVAEFVQLPSSSQMKSLVMMADERPVLAMIRGDHHMSEAKFLAATQASIMRAALPAEIAEWFGAEPGSLGPVGVSKIPVIADTALRGRRNLIAGANRNDYHLRNVTPGRDFQPAYFDLRQVKEADTCKRCSMPLTIRQAVVAARIAKPQSGTGMFHLNIESILHMMSDGDAEGLCLPLSIAPFALVVTPVNVQDAALREAAESIYAACQAAGIEALYDDRNERAGVKFKDADLIGIPSRVTIGGRKLAVDLVELYDRRTRTVRDIPVAGVIEELLDPSKRR